MAILFRIYIFHISPKLKARMEVICVKGTAKKERERKIIISFNISLMILHHQIGSQLKRIATSFLC